MTGMELQLIQLFVTVIAATVSSVIAASTAVNRIVVKNENRFTLLEAQSQQNKANIAEQWAKIDKILSAVQQIQVNCSAMHSHNEGWRQ